MPVLMPILTRTSLRSGVIAGIACMAARIASRRAAGAQRMVGRFVRRVPDRHHGVANELVDGAALCVDRLDGQRQETGEMRLDVGAELFGELGEARADRRT